MKEVNPEGRNIIEPLDPEKHDRTAFSCGVSKVDNFFRQTANRLAKANNLRTFVLVSSGGDVMGFYSLNAHAVDYTDLPNRFARHRPGHGSIPAAYISMIGVDRKCQGSGHGGVLLADCLARIAHVAEDLGIAVAMLDVLDCGDPRQVQRRQMLYQSYGFQPLPSNPLRMFMPLATIRQLVGG
ncbi:MAG: hypothetical protein U5L98_09045 [Halomonas sp.]|uniref:hypothetical protein n=1 Tax=Halomonas sp. TaxID=1486246 RepID=UPI002ACEEA29|nr:hypothetical protein [Halomonas sp.]MDZ7852770.1 hypothetical protein [Halomonas sp.]